MRLLSYKLLVAQFNCFEVRLILNYFLVETIKIEESTEGSPAKKKLSVVPPDLSHVILGETMKFVCPLVLKLDSPPASPGKTSLRAEPRRASRATAKNAADGPSPTTGADKPAQLGVWESVRTPAENSLQVKLKLTSPDPKLSGPCRVLLVDVLRASQSGPGLEDMAAEEEDAWRKTGWPLPKDLRPHQGPHTGHRLCCFSPCGRHLWRLKTEVANTRDGGYVCGFCKKAFKRRKVLRRHERFHTGERPYSCGQCAKTFALRKSLRRHLRFHTGERPHVCPRCSKSFRLRDNLKAHLRFHTGEKPFTCATCAKTFRIVRNLHQHQCKLKALVPSFRTIAGL